MKKQKLNVRMPLYIHAELAEIAYENGLSMNALVVMALQNFVGYVSTNCRLPGTHRNPKRSQKQDTANQSPGRNDPCKCGSGKKYKRCCYPL